MIRSNLLLLFCIPLICFYACDGLFNDDTGDDIQNPGDAPILRCDDFTSDITLENDPDKEVDYIIDCLVEVENTEIEIIDGTVIEFTEGSGIIFNGSARVSFFSSVEEPVVLRGNTPEKGFWKGIHIASDQNSNSISNIEVHHAGSKDDPLFQGAIQVSGVVVIGRAWINESANYGLYYEDEIGRFQNDFVNGAITNCDNYPVRIPVHLLGDLGGDNNNSFSGNHPDLIQVIGRELNKSIIIGSQEIPYEISETLIANSAINIEDDVHLVFREDSRLIINSHINAWDDGGDPIIFTSEKSESGSWQGIYINTAHTSSTNHFENVVIEYGGGQADLSANLAIEGGKVRVQSCQIRYSASCGIKYIDSQSTLFNTDNEFINNANGNVCKVN